MTVLGKPIGKIGGSGIKAPKVKLINNVIGQHGPTGPITSLPQHASVGTAPIAKSPITTISPPKAPTVIGDAPRAPSAPSAPGVDPRDADYWNTINNDEYLRKTGEGKATADTTQANSDFDTHQALLARNLSLDLDATNTNFNKQGLFYSGQLGQARGKLQTNYQTSSEADVNARDRALAGIQGSADQLHHTYGTGTGDNYGTAGYDALQAAVARQLQAKKDNPPPEPVPTIAAPPPTPTGTAPPGSGGVSPTAAQVAQWIRAGTAANQPTTTKAGLQDWYRQIYQHNAGIKKGK